MKEQTCKHTNLEDGKIKNNLTGQYYEWLCLDCGHKKVEGRSYQHKEICEYILNLRAYANAGDFDRVLSALCIINNMSSDAIERLKHKDKDAIEYFETVF